MTHQEVCSVAVTRMLGILGGAWRMRRLSHFLPSDRFQIARWIPLCLAAYVLVGGLVSFMGWALTDGQTAEAGLGYAALPKPVQDKALAELHTITSGGSPIWP